jgi:tetratricopeptide (TPR) repeat protein
MTAPPKPPAAHAAKPPAAVVFAACLFAATGARADDAKPQAVDAKTQAAAHVKAAAEAHGAGRFAAARAELLAAHALDPQPDLLFALGQVHVKLSSCPVAIRLYERFIATGAGEPARGAATEAIEVCKRAPEAPQGDTALERATALHAAGKYAEALPELQLAYALDPQPDLLYAIGQVEVKLGHCPRAVLFYERFLATSPPAGPASAATEAIETCRTRPPPPAGEKRTEVVTTRAPWYTDTLGDALAGAGIALGVGAVFAYGSARSSLDAADRATTYDEHIAAVERASGRRNLAVVLAIGGAAAGTGAVLRFMRGDRTRKETRVIVAPTGDGAAVLLGGRW